MSNAKLTIAIICGSQSPEHEVSVITARIVLENIDRERFNVFPVYIAKNGSWWVKFDPDEKLRNFKADKESLAGWTKIILAPDPKIKRFLGDINGRWEEVGPMIDIFFPTIHGSFGEDGTLQGILEFADLPYVGSGVLGSALGMDKVLLKEVLKAHALPIPKYIWFLRRDWEAKKDNLRREIQKTLRFPVFVKPANGGSSIGVSRANTVDGLDFAIELAASFDRKIIVEEGLVKGIIEVNCAVLGNDDPVASLCYQPIVAGEFQDYAAKYLKKGGTIASQDSGKKANVMKIPAPISERLTQRIQASAIQVFRAIDAAGLARIDFLVDPRHERFWVEEPNTMPGTIGTAVWQASGIQPKELISRLIDLAIDRYEDKKKNIRSFDSPLLAGASSDNPPKIL